MQNFLFAWLLFLLCQQPGALAEALLDDIHVVGLLGDLDQGVEHALRHLTLIELDKVDDLL